MSEDPIIITIIMKCFFQFFPHYKSVSKFLIQSLKFYSIQIHVVEIQGTPQSKNVVFGLVCLVIKIFQERTDDWIHLKFET